MASVLSSWELCCDRGKCSLGCAGEFLPVQVIPQGNPGCEGLGSSPWEGNALWDAVPGSPEWDQFLCELQPRSSWSAPAPSRTTLPVKCVVFGVSLQSPELLEGLSVEAGAKLRLHGASPPGWDDAEFLGEHPPPAALRWGIVKMCIVLLGFGVQDSPAAPVQFFWVLGAFPSCSAWTV